MPMNFINIFYLLFVYNSHLLATELGGSNLIRHLRSSQLSHSIVTINCLNLILLIIYFSSNYFGTESICDAFYISLSTGYVNMVLFVSISIMLAIQLPLHYFTLISKWLISDPICQEKDFVVGCTICPPSFACGRCGMLLVSLERKPHSSPPPVASCYSTVDKDFHKHDLFGWTTSPSSTASR
jgi:hypothetical protein